MSENPEIGDLARASYDGKVKTFIRVAPKHPHNAARWLAADGTHSSDFVMADWWHPLVVIDPEDREQVERLATACRRHFGWAIPATPEDVEATQAALRSLITPPRPEEPTGLGAVVEDVDGRQWLRRTPKREVDLATPWTRVGAEAGVTSRDWRSVQAVTVLHPGWTEDDR